MGRVAAGRGARLRSHARRVFSRDARPAGELARRRACSPSRFSSTSSIYTTWLKRSTPPEHRDRRRRRRLSADDRLGRGDGLAVSFELVLLFLIIFFWTPPHFWALALYSERDDYARAGIPMLPVVAGADASTRLQILVYSADPRAARHRALAAGIYGSDLRNNRRCQRCDHAGARLAGAAMSGLCRARQSADLFAFSIL